MKAIVILAGLAVIGFALYVVGVALVRGVRSWQNGELYPSRKVMRNHQQAIRLIDHWMTDDEIRPFIPADEQDAARKVLADYHGADTPGRSKER